MNGIMGAIQTPLEKTSWNKRYQSDEYAGPCPWCGGNDRFHVYPDANDIPGVGPLGAYLCMGNASGGRSGCGRKGDGIAFIQERDGLTFAEACGRLGIDAQKVLDYRRAQKGLGPSQPMRERKEVLALSETSDVWRENALGLAVKASGLLMGDPLDYLLGRGLTARTIKNHLLGYYDAYRRPKASQWGDPKDFKIWIPRGIVIPWFNDVGQVICLRFRRLPGDESEEARQCYGVDKDGNINRYKHLYGSASRYLYGGNLLSLGGDAAVLEGELDALITEQETVQNPIVIVATGSTGWARSAQSERTLARCKRVLVCYNADESGDRASDYWTGRLRNARRWRPLWSDVNDMKLGDIDIARWIDLGLSTFTLPLYAPSATATAPRVLSIDEYCEVCWVLSPQRLTTLTEDESQGCIHEVSGAYRCHKYNHDSGMTILERTAHLAQERHAMAWQHVRAAQ